MMDHDYERKDLTPRIQPVEHVRRSGPPARSAPCQHPATTGVRVLAALLFTLVAVPLTATGTWAQQAPLELIIGQVSPSPLTNEERNTFPDKAKIVVLSEVPNLRFSSSLGLVQRLPGSDPNRHILVVDPTVQIIDVRSPGFADNRFRVPVVQPGVVRHYQIKPITPELDEGRGNLTLITKPLGATIQIDGPLEPRSTTPYQFLNREARTYRIQLDAPNHKTLIRRIRIAEGESRVEYLELEPDFGYLRVTAVDGADAGLDIADPRLQLEWVEPPSLRVDAVDPQVVLFGVGQPKDGFITVREGVHQFNVSAPGYLDTTIEVQIESGEEAIVSAPMEQRYGWLDLLVTDMSGKVIKGVTPVLPRNAIPDEAPGDRPGIALKAGVHSITLQAPGYEDREVSVRVLGGRRFELPITMLTEREAALEPGTVRIVSDERSIIYVDNRRAGAEEVEIRRVPGTIFIRVEHPYANTTKSHFIQPGANDTLYISSLPTQSKVRTSGLVPGMGHIVSQRPRGWVYLLGTLAAGGYAVWQYREFLDLNEAASQTHARYEVANTEGEILQLAEELTGQIADRDLAEERWKTSRYAAAGIYGLSLLDVSFSKPKYGFRSRARDVKRAMQSATGSAEDLFGSGAYRMRFTPGTPTGESPASMADDAWLRAEFGVVAQPLAIPTAGTSLGLGLRLSIGSSATAK